jgi:hypothetical protein
MRAVVIQFEDAFLINRLLVDFWEFGGKKMAKTLRKGTTAECSTPSFSSPFHKNIAPIRECPETFQTPSETRVMPSYRKTKPARKLAFGRSNLRRFMRRHIFSGCLSRKASEQQTSSPEDGNTTRLDGRTTSLQRQW